MGFTILDYYKGFVSNNFIKQDINQVNLLNKITFLWNEYKKSKLLFFKRKKLGVYVFGSVGTGKTFLLSLFLNFSKVGKKIHFNHLMTQVHDEINLMENKNKKLDLFIQKFCQDIKILFIDELHIFNIVDALIVKKIFNLLEENNVFVIVSSNFN